MHSAQQRWQCLVTLSKTARVYPALAPDTHGPCRAPLQVTSFSELLALRVGFAAAQATQNPICFSLIPELFPAERTTAMAAYNSAIYMGRALSFAAVIIAGQLGVTHSTSESIGVQLVRAPRRLIWLAAGCRAYLIWFWPLHVLSELPSREWSGAKGYRQHIQASRFRKPLCI